jgi:hypothetical protein
MEKTNIRVLSGIRTRDPNNRAAADLRLRPHFIGDFTVLSGVKKLHRTKIRTASLYRDIYEGQTDE